MRAGSIMCWGWKGISCLLLFVVAGRAPASADDIRVVLFDGPLPGTVAGSQMTYAFPPNINSQGRVAFYASFTSPGVQTSGIWSDGNGLLTNVMIEGDPGPGLPQEYRLFYGPHGFVNTAGYAGFGSLFDGPGIDLLVCERRLNKAAQRGC
jgi:hypothetical protein